MQVVEMPVFFSFGKIELGACKDFRIGRHWQQFLHLVGGKRRKLREKFEASFANGLAHRPVSRVCKKHKWGRRTELLALKKQRCPWSKQKQRGHGAIAAGRGLETESLTRRGV